MNYQEPPPRLPPSRHEAILLRALAGLVAIAMLFLAVTELFISGAKGPDSSDGYGPPEGDVQQYLAYAGLMASLTAMGFAIAYASTGKGSRGLWLSLGLAVLVGGAWMLYLKDCCGGLTV
jgi:hypothetical protein